MCSASNFHSSDLVLSLSLLPCSYNSFRIHTVDYTNGANLWWFASEIALIHPSPMTLFSKTNINMLFSVKPIHYSRRWLWWVSTSSLHVGFCSGLSPACLQSVGHPADTILAPFTRVCWPQPVFVVCILNAQQRGIPFGPVVFLKQAICNCSTLYMAWGKLKAQIKWIHILCGPQQRKHSFCCPAVDRTIQPIKLSLWLPLMKISFFFWCLTKFFLSKLASFFFSKS